MLASQLTEIAPEYYETLAFHKSWTWVIWKFLSDPDVGPWTRMRRATREGPEDKAAAQVCLSPTSQSHPLCAMGLRERTLISVEQCCFFLYSS